MKIQSSVLKNTNITTNFGKFHIDKNGVVDVEDNVAQELIDDGLFTKVEDDKEKVKETKVDAPKKEASK